MPVNVVAVILSQHQCDLSVKGFKLWQSEKDSTENKGMLQRHLVYNNEGFYNEISTNSTL